jgi:two-component system, NtrC family, response regulator GlrR
MSSEPSFDTLPLRDEPGAHALVPRFWLLVVGGPDTGATFTSSSERTVIGTYETCDLVLHDSTVSRFHCEIEAARGGLVLRDLGSLNGTTLNGVGVLAAPLESGATIGIGKSQIRFDVGTEPVKVPLSERRSFGALAGDGPELRRLFALLERAAATSQSVLLEGPAPLAAAEAIHEESARRGGPFVAVDCSAVLGAVLDEALFGREGRPGAFEAARGGTIFLAEIADLPLELQPKLLRVLARREVKRAGAAAATPIDVRVIAGTHRNLRADVNAKRFRSDLYFCVATHEVRVPLGAPAPSPFAAARAAYVAAAEKDWADRLRKGKP